MRKQAFLSTFNSVLSHPRNTKPYARPYSWLTTSEEETSTFMNSPVGVLQLVNPRVILSKSLPNLSFPTPDVSS